MGQVPESDFIPEVGKTYVMDEDRVKVEILVTKRNEGSVEGDVVVTLPAGAKFFGIQRFYSDAVNTLRMIRNIIDSQRSPENIVEVIRNWLTQEEKFYHEGGVLEDSFVVTYFLNGEYRTATYDGYLLLNGFEVFPNEIVVREDIGT